MSFFDDLVDSIKKQENPFITIGKAFSDLGTRPLDEAGKTVPTTELAWLLGWIILLPALPVIIVIGGIAFAVMAAINALSR